MIKLICFVRRNPALGREEFHERWRGHHARLIREEPAAIEQLVRYEQNHRLARDYRRDDDFDGVAIQWFDRVRDFAAMIADPGYREHVGTDESELLDLGRIVFLLTEAEAVMIDGPPAGIHDFCKLHCLVARRPGMELDAFHRHWQEVHGPLNRDTPEIARYFLRYEQNHRLRRDYERGGEYDGAAVEWFRSPRDFFAMAADPEYHARIAPDEPNFMDVTKLRWILTGPEEVVVDRR